MLDMVIHIGFMGEEVELPGNQYTTKHRAQPCEASVGARIGGREYRGGGCLGDF
ncbi:hypothetical protein LguiA_026587 [Lonicera macranthoides]